MFSNIQLTKIIQFIYIYIYKLKSKEKKKKGKINGYARCQL